VKRRTSCRPPRTTTATPNVSTSNHGIDRLLDTRQLAVPMLPSSSECTSGEKKYWRRFAITMSKPNVVSSGTSCPARRLRSSIVRWRTYPTTSAPGSTAASARYVETCTCSVKRNAMYAPTSASDPCARLMILITPNMSARPLASSA
jgi:hypothetical protein